MEDQSFSTVEMLTVSELTSHLDAAAHLAAYTPLSDAGTNVAVVVLMCGLSGAGKSNLLKRLTKADAKMSAMPKTFDTVVGVSLDQYGSEVNGKWIVDTNRLEELISENLCYVEGKELFIISGVSSNMDEVLAALERAADKAEASEFNLEVKLIYIWVQPSMELFRITQKRKAEEGAERNLPQTWLNRWNSTATMNDKRLARFLLTETQFFVSKVGGHWDKAIVINNYVKAADSGLAWDR